MNFVALLTLFVTLVNVKCNMYFYSEKNFMGHQTTLIGNINKCSHLIVNENSLSAKSDSGKVCFIYSDPNCLLTNVCIDDNGCIDTSSFINGSKNHSIVCIDGDECDNAYVCKDDALTTTTTSSPTITPNPLTTVSDSQPLTTTPIPSTSSTIPSSTLTNPSSTITTKTDTPTTLTANLNYTTIGTPVVTRVIESVVVKCYKEGPLPHPTDESKYLICEYIFGEWVIFIHNCASGYKWRQTEELCIKPD